MSTLQTAAVRVPIAPTRPYVGLRPYERHESHLLFGRARDARFLVDKILSSRLTVLYGQSGLGKSSLLRALVIPELERQETRVIYYDAWSGEMPEQGLKDHLVALAANLGVADAGAGAPTLLELFRLLRMQEERDLVLVLDQFEEFLVAHSQRLDPLREEIAALSRARDVNVQIVLSLREEFLASLEPFRQKILGLLNSTYRLEPLDDQGSREAVECPVESFGMRYEPAAVTALLRDLGSPGLGGGADAVGGSPGIDLPMLQLVCGRLWEAASARGEREITEALYRSLGEVKQILRSYVLEVMPTRWSGKIVTARLLTLLAPPSGLKISYSSEDLASATGLDEGTVAAELERLSRSRVLRVREYRSGRRFELQHDALINVVGPWRDRTLQLRKQFRVLVVALAVLALILGIAGAEMLRAREELYRNTDGALAALRESPESDRAQNADRVFDNAAGYLLWRSEGERRLERLRDLLIANEDLLPPSYGIFATGADLVAFPATPDWPITFHYSADRALNWMFFQHQWQSMAFRIARDWGVPAPRYLRLQEEPALPTDMIRITGPGIDTVELEVPLYEGRYVISSANLADPARAFMELFPDEWEPVDQLDYGGPWWAVPRWSLPVWKSSGQVAADASGVPALILANFLMDNASALLPPHLVDLLVERVSERYPQTVSEAVAARGDRLAADLASVVENDTPLTDLTMILDALAAYVDESSEEVGELVTLDHRSAIGGSAVAFHGPWPDYGPTGMAASSPGEYGTSQTFAEAYSGVVRDWLLPVQARIRIYYGSDLQARWMPDGTRGEEVRGLEEAYRDELVDRYGIEPPDLWHLTSDWDPSLEPDAYRIEMFNQSASDIDAQPIVAAGSDALEELRADLTYRSDGLRVYMLTAEETRRLLDGLQPSSRSWLEERYSLSDIKLLLRAVIRPDSAELASWAAGSEAAIPPESTIRHSGWLLGSLPFWESLGGGESIERLAGYLRTLQRARLGLTSPPPVSSGTHDLILSGIRAADAGRFVEAERTFGEAVSVDREGAIATFLQLYASHLNTRLVARLSDRCAASGRVETRQDRLDLESAIAAGAWGEAGARRSARLCLLESYATERRTQRASIAAAILEEAGDGTAWPPAEAAEFAHLVLREFDPVRDEPVVARRAGDLLVTARASTDESTARSSFQQLVDTCYEPGPRTWCWNVAQRVATGDGRPSILLDLAYHLSYMEQPEDLRLALDLVQRARTSAAGGVPLTETLSHAASFTRGNALHNLALAGGIRPDPGIGDTLRALLPSADLGSVSRSQLADQLIYEGRLQEAQALLAGSGPGLWHERFWTSLLLGDTAAAAAIAEDVFGIAGRTDDNFFLAAVGKTLTQSRDWEVTTRQFLATDHAYVPYVAMLLHAHSPEAQRVESLGVLRRRWAAVDSATWQPRLRQGDPRAWREMLIGYYLGEVEPARIFTPLEEDASWAASDLRHLPLPRRALLTEAYFYDAMLARARGDRARQIERLQEVLATNYPRYLEHRMATFLLRGLVPRPVARSPAPAGSADAGVR